MRRLTNTRSYADTIAGPMQATGVRKNDDDGSVAAGGNGMRTSMRLIPVVVVDVYNVSIKMSSDHKMTILIFFLLNFLVWKYINCPLFYTHNNDHIYTMYILLKYFCAMYALIFFACNICS